MKRLREVAEATVIFGVAVVGLVVSSATEYVGEFVNKFRRPR